MPGALWHARSESSLCRIGGAANAPVNCIRQATASLDCRSLRRESLAPESCHSSGFSAPLKPNVAELGMARDSSQRRMLHIRTGKVRDRPGRGRLADLATWTIQCVSPALPVLP